MKLGEPKLPPPTTKNCEKRGCHKRAAGFVIFEVKKEGTATAILPKEWRCLDHANLNREMTQEEWKTVREEFGKRLGYLPNRIEAALSTLNESEVDELKFLASVNPTHVNPTEELEDVSIDHLGKDEFDATGNLRKGVLQ